MSVRNINPGITFHPPKTLAQKLRAIAKKEGTSMSSIIIKALEQYFKTIA